MAITLVFGVMPGEAFLAFAASYAYPEAVTITVTDTEGNPISGADVAFKVDSVANGDGFITGTEKTGEDGVIPVIPADSFVTEDLTISATVTAEGWESMTLEATAVVSGDQDFKVVLTAVDQTPEIPEIPTIEDVTITADGWIYDGSEHPLVTVQAQEGDIVSYKLGAGEYQAEVPAAVYAGEYEITVKVERAGYETYEVLRKVTVSKAQRNLTLTAMEGLIYNGQTQTLAVLNGAGDLTVVWTVGNEAAQNPEATDAGTYQVTAKVAGDDNYHDFEQTVEVVIQPAAISGVRLVIKTGLEYNESAQVLASLTNTEEGDKVTWFIGGVEVAEPVGTGVGAYVVSVKVERANHATLEFDAVTVNIAAGQLNVEGLEISPYTGVYDAENHPAVAVTVPEGHSYQIQYQLVELENDVPVVDEEAWNAEIPEITNAGQYHIAVRVVKDGYHTVYKGTYTARIDKADQTLGFKSFTGAEADMSVAGQTQQSFAAEITGLNSGNFVVYSLTAGESIAAMNPESGMLTVIGAGKIVVNAYIAGNDNFNENSISFTLNVTQIAGSDQKLISFDGDVAYVFGENEGVASNKTVAVKYNNDNGDITYSLVGENTYGLAIKANGEVYISNYDNLAKALVDNSGMVTITVNAQKEAVAGLYGADDASYQITITWMDMGEDPYKVEGDKQSKDANGQTWYATYAIITPAEAYNISFQYPNSFGENPVWITTEGSDSYVVYLQHNRTGGIARYEVPLNLDKTAPEELKITYDKKNFVQKLDEILGFYKDTVTVRVEAKDAGSGVNFFEYVYTVSDGVSDVNQGGEGTVEALYDKENDTYYATFDIPAQFRGNVSFTAVDCVENASTLTDEGYVVVVDKIAPNVEISYNDNIAAKNGEVLNHTRTATIIAKEANFFAEDVQIILSKAETADGPWVPVAHENKFVPGEEADTHVLTIDFVEEGHYKLDVIYTDKSGNVYDAYAEDSFVIDLTDPRVTVDVSSDEKPNGNYFKVARKATIKVIEHNFDPEKFVALVNDKAVSGLKWNHDGDEHTAEYSFKDDGFYTFSVSYVDNANRVASVSYGDSIAPTDFVVDKNPAYGLKVSYPESSFIEVLGQMMGFFKDTVTVRVEAKDATSGVSSFKYAYDVSEDVSNVNRGGEGALEAEYDEATNTYFATFDIPAQFRGLVTFTAVDKANNEATYVDGKIIVVDDKAPVIGVTYEDEADSFHNGIYTKDRKIQVTVEEANWFAEDLKITVFRTDDNGKTWETTPVMAFVSNGDIHTSEQVIFDQDGDYYFVISYTDRSGNQAETYQSEMFTIDKTDPVVTVEVTNNTVFNDKFFQAERSALIKVVEHNFDEAGFVALVNNQPYQGLEWTRSGNTYTATIPFIDDGFYKLNISCKDMAGRTATVSYGDSVAPTDFVVDKTPATELKISYDQKNFVQMVGELLGFYKDTVTVRIEAKDATSGVDFFEYAFDVSKDASSVNQGGKGTLMAVYDETTKTYYAVFDIPAQFRGQITFTAVDYADNKVTLTDEGYVVVVDKIAPGVEISYSDGIQTKAGEVLDHVRTATIVVTEANFFAEDVKIFIGKAETKNGPWVTTAYEPKFVSDKEEDTYILKIPFSENGHYKLDITYADKSGNIYDAYV